MRGARFALLALGTALCLALLWSIGLVFSALGMLSWRLPIVLCFPACLMVVCDTLGWRFAFPSDRVPFGALGSARRAGEALNISTPTASVGGEPVKAWLVRAYVPLSESLPSFAAFVIPAWLGTQEAGDVAVFTALGFGAPTGLAFSLVRRLREVLLAAVGFVALAVLSRENWRTHYLGEGCLV